MILIITESSDKVSDNVIDWLNYYNKRFIRLSYPSDVILQSLKLSNDEESGCLVYNNVNIELSEITSIWYRRATLNLLCGVDKSKVISNYIRTQLKNDQELIVDALENIMSSDKPYIGSHKQSLNVNKVNNLKLAKDIGFIIPDTLITTRKSELLKFTKKHAKVIAKNLSEGIDGEINNLTLTPSLTSLVNKDFLEGLTDYFSLSLFQEYIEKEVEIRVFFINDSLFAMAIFSQENSSTSIDYRNYQENQQNRNVPFKLPITIKNMIIEFSEKAGLNTGSFDIILTPKKEFVFLEVNPVGQFHWLSEECNYYIEKHIAEIL